jgi:hypothetical protein
MGHNHLVHLILNAGSVKLNKTLLSIFFVTLRFTALNLEHVSLLLWQCERNRCERTSYGIAAKTI